LRSTAPGLPVHRQLARQVAVDRPPAPDDDLGGLHRDRRGDRGRPRPPGGGAAGGSPAAGDSRAPAAPGPTASACPAAASWPGDAPPLTVPPSLQDFLAGAGGV